MIWSPEYTTLLDLQLTRVIDLLKFAESKNSMLIAFLSAILIGINSQAPSYNAIDCYLLIYILAFHLLALSSLVVCIVSFIPIVELPTWIRCDDQSAEDNPLYFGDACKYTTKQYIGLLVKKYNLQPIDSHGMSIEADICGQIVTNSKIAYIKYKYFNYSVWLFLIALLTPLGAFALYYFSNRRN